MNTIRYFITPILFLVFTIAKPQSSSEEILRKLFIQQSVKMDTLKYKVYTDNSLFGLKDMRSGKYLTDPIYEFMNGFSSGRAVVAKDGKYGFIDTIGKVVIDLQYSDASSFSSNRAFVQNKDRNYAMIDPSGKFITDYKYSYTSYFSYGLVRVSESSFINGEDYTKESYIDTNGVKLKTVEFQLGAPFCSGVASVRKGDKYGFIDTQGKLIIPFKYDRAFSMGEGIAPVSIKGKYGFIDSTGKTVIPFIYDGNDQKGFPNYFLQQGLILIKKDGKYGFIDIKGNVKIPFIYEDACTGFNQFGVTTVKLNGKAGAINIKNEVVVPFKYDNFFPGFDKIVLITQGKWVTFDQTGKCIYNCGLEIK